MPGELEHEIKCRCNQSCTLDDISNTLQDSRKGKNIGKNSLYRGNSFKEKQPYRFENKYKQKKSDVTKKKYTCQNCGSTDYYAKNFPKAKKKVYAIKQVPEEESPTDNSESDSMVDAIRKLSDYDQDPREEFLENYQEETQLEIQYIELEAGIPQDTAKKNLCKHTKDAYIFLVTSIRGMAYIHGTATKMTVCINNSQNPLIIDSGAHFSIVAKDYLDNHFSNWEKKLLQTKAEILKVHQGR
ncbi:hypothetical protein O181_027954 [Austropuccinia psidii MF-1]|uniref:Uncharacterized protein n=1 Tax=Austropuccinia psidii MF-1 TaxID=1389203 RepID=A0A9Q3CPU7_9BASI|nr:hypothetical protein [Austropuccinia psidii MF-1]